MRDFEIVQRILQIAQIDKWRTTIIDHAMLGTSAFLFETVF